MVSRLKTAFITTALVLLANLAVISEASAGDYEIDMSDIDIPEIEIADWQVAGDGKTPTFLQYLDTKAFEAKEAKHLIAATSKGDAVYSLAVELPPASLKPTLTLSYSSSAGMNVEMPYGWELKGIAEIRRPLERAFEKKEEGWDGEWLAVAPGFSGTLKMSGNEDYRYFLRSAGTTRTFADYNKNANSWELHHDGITFKLTEQDDGANTTAGTAWWRTTQMQDASGNYVTYAYHNDGRIKAVCYGGNLTTGDDHLVDVTFDYDENAVERTSARAGFLVTYEYHIVKITVGAHDDSCASNMLSGAKAAVVSGFNTLTTSPLGTAALSDDVVFTGASDVTKMTTASASLKTVAALTSFAWYAYNLITTATDDLDLMTKITRADASDTMLSGAFSSGSSTADTETLAEFEYSEYENDDDPARTSSTMVPSSLGETRSHSEGEREDSTSKTVETLADFTGDGLPDEIFASDAWSGDSDEWEISNQKVNSSARSFSWESARSIAADDHALGEVTIKESTDGSPATRALTTRTLLDFDGDGFLDYLIADNEDEWEVYYGSATHHLGTEHQGYGGTSIEDPPSLWEYAQVSWSLKADDRDAEDFTKDVANGLVDFNGDGWVDCYDPAEGAVYLHAGEREGGWPTKLNLSHTFPALRSVKYTIKSDTFEVDVEGYCEEELEGQCSYGADDAYDYCLEEEESECETDCEADDCWCDEQAEENCDNGDDGNVWDNAYDDCMEEGMQECTNVDSERQYYIAATDEFGAMYDMNGDGLTDYVDASATPWKVYFNTGYDFENGVSWTAPAKYIRRSDEGRPEIEWESNDMGITERESGDPAHVYQMLADVNGDGLLDLAMGKDIGDKWYRNTGAGFATTSKSLPDWWPDDFITSEAKTEVDGDNGESDGESEITTTMIDLDHDGAIDSIGAATVKYGPYPRPYILTEVKNGQGGTTSVTYRSLATVSPSGDWDDAQKTPNVKHLADVIFSIDGYTGENAQTSFEYANGNFTDGVFLGFTDRDISREINGDWTSETKYDYELDTYLEPLVTLEKLYVDGNLSFGSAIRKSSSPSEKIRFKIENTYGDYAPAGRGDGKIRLITTRKITEYGESSGSEAQTLTFTWDDYGNMTKYAHDGGGDADDAVIIGMSYTADSDDLEDSASMFRMKEKNVSGTDPLSGSSRMFAIEQYYYDGHTDLDEALTLGLLTKTESLAGWTDGGEALGAESLVIDYGRGSRGELTSVADATLGIRIDQTFGWGGAVIETQTNALGQKITHAIDARGRVKSITDDNGMKIGFSYDAFNRVIKKTVTGSDGKTYTYKTTDFERASAIYYDAVTFFKDDGSTERVSYTVEDGFANPVQTWSQNEDGHYLVTTQIHDLRGLLTGTSHPEDKGSSFSMPMTSLGISKTFSLAYHDALGATREIVRDSTAGTGSQLIYRNNPRVELRQDEEGYQTQLTYDAHGRVIKVEQGKSSAFTTTAKYRYDPLNRLTKFTDGNGVYYTYSHDGAGRLRRVQYGKSATLGALTSIAVTATSPSKAVMTSIPSTSSGATSSSSSSADTTWYTYEYTGGLKTKMTDAAGLKTEWKYDTAGRITTITTSDGLPSAVGDLTFEYDYDDAWVGQVTKITEPFGTTEYTYDEFGREATAKSSYTASAASTSGLSAEFAYDRDLRGRLTAKILPSGRTSSLEYSYGYLDKATFSTSGTTDYSLRFDYNDWGLWSKATSSLGHKYSRTFTTPLWPDEIAMQFGDTAYQRGYTWLKNSLLIRRTESVNTSASSTPTISGAITPATSGAALTAKTTGTKTTTAIKATAVKSKLTGVTAGSAVSGGASSASTVVATAVISPKTYYDYSYDLRKQVTQLTSSASLSPMLGGSTKTIETYAYDDAGNPTAMQDASGANWTYGTAGALNQIASRTSTMGGSESYIYDAAGRVTEWKSSAGTYNYYYTGLGQLRGVSLNGVWQAVYDYDADGNLARTADNNPHTSTPYYSYQFRDWRYDEKTAVTFEEDNAFVTTEGGTRTWMLKDYDGHAALTFDDSGAKTSSRTLGAFGGAVAESGTTWDRRSFHGTEEKYELFRMGQRHLTQKDGQWLQPEPWLYLGIPADALSAPLSLATYRYAMNSPATFSDISGFDPEDINVEPTGETDVESPLETATDLDLAGEIPETSAQVLFDAASKVNPDAGKTNCGSTSIATDLAISGTPAVAGRETKAGDEITGTFEHDVENYYGKEFIDVAGGEDAKAVMQDAGPGSHGIVKGLIVTNVQTVGDTTFTFGTNHFFNWANVNGRIVLLDGQQADGVFDMSQRVVFESVLVTSEP